MFPAFLLKKVYVQGSLKNIDHGFQFNLKNIIDTGTLGGIKSLTIDGVEVPLSSISVKTQAFEKKAEEINFRNSIPLRINMEAIFIVADQTLPAGEHEIKLSLNVLEAGKIDIPIKDTVA
jgi:hypothetical protein